MDWMLSTDGVPDDGDGVFDVNQIVALDFTETQRDTIMRWLLKNKGATFGVLCFRDTEGRFHVVAEYPM